MICFWSSRSSKITVKKPLAHRWRSKGAFGYPLILIHRSISTSFEQIPMNLQMNPWSWTKWLDFSRWLLRITTLDSWFLLDGNDLSYTTTIETEGRWFELFTFVLAGAGRGGSRWTKRVNEDGLEGWGRSLSSGRPHHEPTHPEACVRAHQW